MTKARKLTELLDLTAGIWREEEDSVSLRPELGVSSCGETLQDATAMLKEAVDLFLENARELGMLDGEKYPQRARPWRSVAAIA